MALESSLEVVVQLLQLLCIGHFADMLRDSAQSCQTVVLFGQARGPLPPLDAQVLSQRGSLYLTRPTLFHYTATREELLQRANDLFTWMSEGWLHVRVDREYALRDAAAAHRALEGRETTGKVLLLP